MILLGTERDAVTCLEIALAIALNGFPSELREGSLPSSLKSIGYVGSLLATPRGRPSVRPSVRSSAARSGSGVAGLEGAWQGEGGKEEGRKGGKREWISAN